jgi:hypothetical protein
MKMKWIYKKVFFGGVEFSAIYDKELKYWFLLFY